MFKKNFLLSLFLFLICCFVFPVIVLSEETLTITTYYPSPYGSYRELETRILHFGEEKDGLMNFNYPDTTYDRRLRITAGKEDTQDNDQGASIDLHGNIHANVGRLDLVAGRNANITFWTSPTGASASERMRITNTGLVGIGTTKPISKLEVNTNAAWDRSNTYAFNFTNLDPQSGEGWGMLIRGGSNENVANTFAVQDYSGNTNFIVKGSGNVGIGTTAPGQRLEVNGTMNATALAGAWDKSSSGYIRIGNTQICWGTFGAIAHGSLSGSVWYGLGSAVTFPAAFKSGTVPVVNTMPHYNSDGVFSIVCAAANNSSFTPMAWASASGSTGTSNRYVAIGVWQ